MSDLFSVAVVQTNSGPELVANAERACELIRGCVADHNPRFVTLPENALLMPDSRQAFLAQTPKEDENAGLAMIQRQAKESDVYIALGSVATDTGRADGRRANRMFIIAPTGDIICRYDKIHMFDAAVAEGESHTESDRYAPGDKAVMCDIDGFNVGCTICYDLRFPDIFRAYAHAGAHIILAPAAFTAFTGAIHWQPLLQARAIETGAFVVAAAQTGTHPLGRKTYGHSLIAGPWGDMPALLKEGEGYACAQLDMNIPADFRKQIPAPVTCATYRMPGSE